MKEKADMGTLLSELDVVLARFYDRADAARATGSRRSAAFWAKAADEIDEVLAGVRGDEHQDAPLPWER